MAWYLDYGWIKESSNLFYYAYLATAFLFGKQPYFSLALITLIQLDGGAHGSWLPRSAFFQELDDLFLLMQLSPSWGASRSWQVLIELEFASLSRPWGDVYFHFEEKLDPTWGDSFKIAFLYYITQSFHFGFKHFYIELFFLF